MSSVRRIRLAINERAEVIAQQGSLRGERVAFRIGIRLVSESC